MMISFVNKLYSLSHIVYIEAINKLHGKYSIRDEVRAVT